MLKHRILTAAVLLPVFVLTVLFAPAWFFLTLMLLVAVLAGWEWAAIADISDRRQRIYYILILLAAIGLFYYIPTQVLFSLAMLVWLWACVAVVMYRSEDKTALGFHYPWVRRVLGIVLLAAAWQAMLILQWSSNLGPRWFLLVLCIAWAADVGAYFSRRFLGKRLLAPYVSPKKTWEGLAGGLVSAMLVAAVFNHLLSLTGMEQIELSVLVILTALFSVFGDLFESLLKRLAGVKDSGQLLPGHGGVLDRIDSVIAAVTLFVFGLLMLGLVK